MNEAIYQTYITFSPKTLTTNQKAKSVHKDLFSEKLGQTIMCTPQIMKRRKLPSLKSPFYLKNTPGKFHSNNLSSIVNNDDLANLINKMNKFLPRKQKTINDENNKQMLKTNITNDYANGNYTQKSIEKLLSYNKKSFERNNDKKIESINSNTNTNTNTNINTNIKDSPFYQTIEKQNNRNILQSINNTHRFKNILKKEKRNFDIKAYNTFDRIKMLRIRKFKSKEKEKEKLNFLVSPYTINNKEEKNSIIFMRNFYEDFIDLFNSYDSKVKYISKINNFNETYFYLFEINSFPKIEINIKFLDTFKYSSILIICLIFLSKDEKLYDDSKLKMKEFLEKFIFICLKAINYKILESQKINNFIKDIRILNEENLNEILNNIIFLLFSDKMNDYKKVRKCLRQLLNNINNDTPENILDIINKCILYCHNNSLQIKSKKKKNASNDLYSSGKSLNNNKIISKPFIKEKMKKNFCLVLDLDETLIHNLNLPFGDYFFARPGLFEFLEKIHDFFEIIIFTAGQKNYAYSIIDVIDDNDYIDHILYKKHLIYENGNPIKKLDMIGRDTKKIIFVDNLESNAKYNKKNLYLISSWYDNIYDKELYKLQEKLIKIVKSGRFTDDITKGLIENFM